MQAVKPRRLQRLLRQALQLRQSPLRLRHLRLSRLQHLRQLRRRKAMAGKHRPLQPLRLHPSRLQRRLRQHRLHHRLHQLHRRLPQLHRRLPRLRHRQLQRHHRQLQPRRPSTRPTTSDPRDRLLLLTARSFLKLTSSLPGPATSIPSSGSKRKLRNRGTIQTVAFRLMTKPRTITSTAF